MSGDGVNRRHFMKVVGAGTVAASALSGLVSRAAGRRGGPPPEDWEEPRRALRVKPVLVYHVPQRREARSYRSWGGIRSEAAADKESDRIKKELNELSGAADFPIEVLPLARANSHSRAAAMKDADCDVVLIYAAGGGTGWYNELCSGDHHYLWFLRHRSGPSYLWYEIVHPRFLRKNTDTYHQGNVTTDDVVVDDYGEVLWRLRALCGLVNTAETTILAFGGAGGWGQGARYGPKNAGEIWNIDVRDASREALGERVDALRKDEKALKECEREARQYVEGKGVESVETDWKFVLNSFLLRRAVVETMREQDASAMTINGCMNFGRWVDTSPCLTFMLINDSGLMAFCESDFTVIPAGILLRHICGRPVFLHNPTWPHDGGLMTGAHCTAPRRMSGRELDPVRILTHYESDWGAAPKVQFPEGQTLTSLVPSFTSENWLGVRSKVAGHPFFDICRSQFEMDIEGDWEGLIEDMQGFHWMTCYGDYLREVGYLLGKIDRINWHNISGTA